MVLSKIINGLGKFLSRADLSGGKLFLLAILFSGLQYSHAHHRDVNYVVDPHGKTVHAMKMARH